MLWNGNKCEKKTKVMRNSREKPPVQKMLDQKQLENVEYFKNFGSVITDARYKHEIKARIVIQKAAFNSKQNFHQENGLKEETSEVLHFEHNFVRC
jgi:hypothetical protein